ncbi:MAG: NTP transferase domain-containing protein [Fibrobacteria bacterium]
MNRKVSCVVPARLASLRFPNKLIQPLLGTPIIIHTLRRAQEAGCFDEVLCLTDAQEIRDLVSEAGFRVEVTGPAANGTERIGKYHDFVANDLIVNLQGDEPAFSPQALRLLYRALTLEPENVHILVHEHAVSLEDLVNPNRCKAALNADGYVVDFYRRAPRNHGIESRLQMGSYGYSKTYVRKYALGAPSGLELSESHELLRDLGAAQIRAHACPFPSQAVDVPQDVEAALALLRRGFPDLVDNSMLSAEALANHE